MTELAKPGEKRGPIAWMVGHSVAANLIMLLCLLGGYMSLRKIKQEVFPNLDTDEVTVSVAYPGASPEEIEEGILQAIEEAVRGIDGVDEVNSVASEGSGRVTIEALLDSDVRQLAQDIKSEVDRILTFPIDAEEPQVEIVQRKREVMQVLVYGDAAKTSLHELAEQTRDELLRHEDVTQVEVSGLPPLEIGIEISEVDLRAYGLTIADVARRLREASVDIPGGGLKTGSGEILVRVKERRDYGRQFAELPIIITDDGAEVLLGQIATIDDSFADTDRYAIYNGKPAVLLAVYRVGDQTPLAVSDAVHGDLERIKAILPDGISVGIENDRSDIYRQRMNLLLRNGALGLVLVLAVLGLFLEARLAFWVMMGIPISFLGSFLFLPSMDVTVNMISMFAYIVALGIVVDDAIVVGENIYHYHQEGMSFGKAAVRGAREVAMPVTFSILTNIVAFLPLYFVPGFMGKIFMMMPVVVCTVFLISLVESLFVLPSHLGHTRERTARGLFGGVHKCQQAFSHWFTRWVSRRYGPFLDFTLRHRVLTVSFSLSVLVIAVAYAASGRMGFQLFPVVEADYSQAEVVLPYGAPVVKTEKVMQRLLAGARQVAADSGHPELLKSVVADVGRGGGHVGSVRAVLADPEVRDKIMSTAAFTDAWRDAVGEVAGVESLRFRADAGGPGSHGRPVTVELSHRDIDVLAKASRELADAMETYPRVSDVDDGFQPGKPQLDFIVKSEGKRLGLTAAEIARQVRGAFYGAEVVRQQRGRNEIKVMVRLPDADRSTEQTLYDALVRTPAGKYVQLREVAEYKRGRAYTTIDRRDGKRVVQVGANMAPRNEAGEVLSGLRADVLPGLTEKYRGLSFSFEGHRADMRESMGSLKVTFPLALLAIYGLLAIPFRSYAQPLIVMMSIPFGIVGAFAGHLVMGYGLCIPSMFGIVALAGVVVNDSLVMVDYANQRRKTGLGPHDAIHAAGVQRFRPIMLTTLTTFGGLAPMIFETSRQAKFLVPMALSLGFGILFATFITLVIVPSLYMTIEDGKRVVGNTWRFLFPAPAPEPPGLADTLVAATLAGKGQPKTPPTDDLVMRE